MSDRSQESDLQRPTEAPRASAHAPTTMPVQSRSHWLSSRMSSATPEGLSNRAAQALASGTETDALPTFLSKSIDAAHPDLHWISEGMSTAAPALPVSLPPPAEAPGAPRAPLQAEDVESLRRALAMAQVLPISSEEAAVPSPPNVAPLAAADLPIGLTQPTAFEDIATDDEVNGHHAWLALRPSSTVLGWSAATIGAVLLVAVVRHAADKPSSQLRSVASPPVTVEAVTATSSIEESAAGFTEATTPPATEQMADVVFYPSETASPGLALALGPPPVWQEANTDLVETIVVRGLPPEVQLSAGRKVSETDWELEPADAHDVGFVVPSDRTEPVSADIEFKSRAGEVVARLGLHVDREVPPTPPTLTTQMPVLLEAIRASQSDPPEIAVQEGAGKSTADAGERQEEARPPRALPAPARRNNKASSIKAKPMNLGGAKGKPAYSKAAAAAKAPAANPFPPPRGLFQFGPGGIKVSPGVKVSGLAPTTPLPAAAPSAAAPSTSASENPDRPPGYETLETLGGGFMLGQP